MLIIYILLRLFVRKKHEFVEGDELRYLACAKDFYKLWNKSTYDTHPPFYSWLIKQFSIFIRGYYAGIVVSLLSSIGLWFVCSRLYDVLGLTLAQKQIALACLAFNYTLIYYSNRVFRYQLIALLGTATLLFLLTSSLFLSGICWGLLGLTCVYAGLRGFWIWAFTSASLISLVVYSVLFGSWLVTKAKIYKAHEYYPSGIDGKIEPVKNFSLKQLFSPLYFPWTYAYYGKRELGYDFKNWFKKIGGMYGLYRTDRKNINILVSILTMFMLILTVKGMASAPLNLVILTLILLLPSIYKRFLPRNSIMAIPLLCYFVGKGLPQSLLMSNLDIIILVVLVIFLAIHRVFILFQPKIKARVTSKCLDDLPGDGVLVEGLIAYPIAYRSKKRTVCLPHDPDPEKAKEQTDLSIKHFKLNYAVFSELWKTEEYLGYPAIEYIKSFRLIKIIREDEDIYYVYALFANFTA